LAFSCEGALLATASDNNTPEIWDLSTWSSRRKLKGHTDSVTSVAFSPDGTLLASASADKTARIWDVATGALRATLKGHARSVTSAAFSPDGTLLATVADRDEVRIWDISTGSTVAVIDSYTNAGSLAFSPDGTLLAATTWTDATIWDLKTQAAPLRQTRFVDRVVRAIRSSPKTFETWTILEGHTGLVTCVAFSDDGALIATGSEDTTARIWDLAGHSLFTLPRHSAPVFSVAFSPDGSLLATGSDVVRIWDLPRGGSPTVLITLIALREGGYATLTSDGYKLDGNPGNDLWWAIKLCRFAPGELDSYIPGLQRLPARARILPLSNRKE
jgi:WD40 repeat protein